MSCEQNAQSLQTRGNLANGQVMAGHEGDASSPFTNWSAGPWTPTRHGPALDGAVLLGDLEEEWPRSEAQPWGTYRKYPKYMSWLDCMGTRSGRDESRLGLGPEQTLRPCPPLFPSDPLPSSSPG